MIDVSGNGITHLVSARSVDVVLQELLSLLEAKGIKLFALVDHSGEAAKAGLEMPPTKLVIFGNPKAGTPSMLAEPDCALDLPLKILIAQTADGTTRISFNSVEYLRARYSLAPEAVVNLAAIQQIAAAIAG